MQLTKPEVALVVPCFNEAHRLPKKYWENLLYAHSSILWLFVDDGSSDSTESILANLCEGRNASYLRLSRNLGKGNAIRMGLANVLSENVNLKFVGYLDSDGAFSESDILNLISMATKNVESNPKTTYDIWISSRVALAGRFVQRRISRHYLGRVVATVITRSWNDAPYDTQSGFKIFRVSEVFKKAIEQEFRTRWFVDVEILTRIGIEREGLLEIWEEPVTQWHDVEGSKISLKALISIFRELLYARTQVKELLKVRRAYGSN